MPYEDSAPVTASTSASSMGRKRSAVAPQETHTSGGAAPSWIQPHTLHRNMGRHFPLGNLILRARASRIDLAMPSIPAPPALSAVVPASRSLRNPCNLRNLHLGAQDTDRDSLQDLVGVDGGRRPFASQPGKEIPRGEFRHTVP